MQKQLLKEYIKSVKTKHKPPTAPKEITEELLERFKNVRGGGLVFDI